MKLFRKKYTSNRKTDTNLYILFSVLILSFFACILVFPNILFRSSKAFDKIYWSIASQSFEEEHIKNTYPTSIDNGAIVIMFDDGWMTQFTQGYSIMNKYQFKGSIAVISDCVGENEYMGLKELSKMYKNGWDMSNHTKSHPWLNEIDKQRQTEELTNCRLWLKKYHLTGAENIAIFPGGYSNIDTFKALTDTGFTSARSVEDYWTITPPSRIDDITVISVTPALSLKEVKQIIKETKAEKRILILIYHKFSNTPDAWGMSYPPKNFDKTCEMIKNSALPVLTISQLQSALYTESNTQ